MKRFFLLLALTIPLSLIGLPAAVSADQSAQAIAERLVEKMGGQQAFDETRLLRFDFAVSRGETEVARYRHWWDRWSGDYQVEGTNREGQSFRVLFNVQTREGDAWLDGEPQEGDSLEALLESAYGRFINDTYWFLMPWKWLDPGVTLELEAPREIDGTTYDVVKLRFDDGIGLTSGDQYWGLVSRDSGLMERWEYLLQQKDGSAGEGERSAFAWVDWETTQSGLNLSGVKKPVAGDYTIHFPVLKGYPTASEEEIDAFFSGVDPEEDSNAMH